MEATKAAVPTAIVETARNAYEDGYAIVAGWINAALAKHGISARVEPGRVRLNHPTLAQCRTSLERAMDQIGAYGVDIPAATRIEPWMVYCTSNGMQFSVTLVHSGGGAPESAEDVAWHFSHQANHPVPESWWTEFVVKAVHQRADEWRDWFKQFSETKQENNNRKDRSKSWLGPALMLIQSQPGLKDAEVARRTGIDRSTLSRDENYQSVAKRARELAQQNSGVARGFRQTNDDGGIETDGTKAGDKPDRGEPIKGSKYFREYCAECQEPMKVPADQVGNNPVCEECCGNN
jgi:hypothetical protein